jgi:ATP-dependent Clp protease, protease subunit
VLLSQTMRVVLAGTLCIPSLFAQAPTPALKTTVIRFYAPVNEATVAQLLTAVDQKLKAGTKRFVLLISSPGGSVFAGLTAYHYLKGIPAEIETHDFGEVYSIATVIYCAGSKRYSVQEGRFLMHGVTLNLPANTPLDESNVGEQLKLMQQQISSIAAVIAETVKKPVSEVQGLIDHHTVYSAAEAQRFGLVTEIRSKLYDEGADLISIGELIPPTGTQELADLPSSKEITYSTNINRVSTTFRDFSTRTTDLFTSTIDVGSSSPFDQFSTIQ